MSLSGSMARTMEDLVLLDSIVRLSNFSSDAYGLLEEPVSCAIDVDRNFNLTGVRLGLPSTFGWQFPGLSEEVRNWCRGRVCHHRGFGTLFGCCFKFGRSAGTRCD